MAQNEMYILYADIMGFKDRVMRTSHEKLVKDFEDMISSLEKWFSPSKKASTFKVSFFSDSILVVDANTKDGFNRISKAAAGIMQVSLKNGFAVKGVISKGDFTYKEEQQLFLGRALVDAFLLEEQLHYYGIVAHHSVEDSINEWANGWQGATSKKNPYVLSPTPLKNGNITHYHLAYNLISRTRKTGSNVKSTHDDIISWLQQIRATVSGSPRIYVDKTIQILEEDLKLFNQKDGNEVIFPLS